MSAQIVLVAVILKATVVTRMLDSRVAVAVAVAFVGQWLFASRITQRRTSLVFLKGDDDGLSLLTTGRPNDCFHSC